MRPPNIAKVSYSDGARRKAGVGLLRNLKSSYHLTDARSVSGGLLGNIKLRRRLVARIDESTEAACKVQPFRIHAPGIPSEPAEEGVACARPADVATQQRNIRVSRMSLPK